MQNLLAYQRTYRMAVIRERRSDSKDTLGEVGSLEVPIS